MKENYKIKAQYIHIGTGESYLFQSEGLAQFLGSWMECVIYEKAVDGTVPFVRTKDDWEKSFKVVPDLTDKWVQCLKEPTDLCNQKFEVGKHYQVITDSGLAPGKPILHTNFGQGLGLYAPHIDEYFDIFNAKDKRPDEEWKRTH